jgi:hypothetical protein
VVLALIAGSAVYEGIKTERWAKRETTAEQKELAERMASIPFAFGDWESNDEPISQRDLEGARATGHYSRRFHNRLDSSKEVSVLIIVGAPADVCEHTPDKCYANSGFNAMGGDEHYIINLGKASAEFNTDRFRKGESGEAIQNLRIFWSFSVDGNWLAPNAPKYQFQLAGYSALCKIYAITELPANSEGRPDESAAVGFLEKFLPVVNQHLFPSDKGSQSGQKTADESASKAPADSSDKAGEARPVPVPPAEAK